MNGLIYDGKKVYVGSEHGKPIKLSKENIFKVQKLAKEYGIWYEGDGKDIENNVAIFGPKSKYEGSWDYALQKSIKGYPKHFLSVLFSNVAINGQKKVYLEPSMSIFDSIIKHREKNYFQDDRPIPKTTLSEFLIEGSEKGFDFLEMSKERATKENVSKFFDAGEKLMWPSNWSDYPNKFGKLARDFETARNQFLINQTSGVFVVGEGHLIELRNMNKKLEIEH